VGESSQACPARAPQLRLAGSARRRGGGARPFVRWAARHTGEGRASNCCWKARPARPLATTAEQRVPPCGPLAPRDTLA